MSWAHQNQMGDPARVAERSELLEIEKDYQMAQRLKEIPEHIQRDMHQWGEWAQRRQFWANLNITPFCKLVGLYSGGEAPNIRLDPQSMAIHKAVMNLDDGHKMVVFAYFVARVWHEDKPELFNGHGISRATYYRRLTAGTVQAHNNAMRWLEQARNSL